MAGIGIPELIVILIIGLLIFGLPIAGVIVIILLIRSQSSRRIAELQDENEHLRRQLKERDKMHGERK